MPHRPQAVFSHLLDYCHVQAEDKNPSILQVFESIRQRLPERVFPFAADPFGNFLCFDYRTKDTPVVVFWDHETAFQSPNDALEFVCNGFSDLMNLLYET